MTDGSGQTDGHRRRRRWIIHHPAFPGEFDGSEVSGGGQPLIKRASPIPCHCFASERELAGVVRPVAVSARSFRSPPLHSSRTMQSARAGAASLSSLLSVALRSGLGRHKTTSLATRTPSSPWLRERIRCRHASASASHVHVRLGHHHRGCLAGTTRVRGWGWCAPHASVATRAAAASHDDGRPHDASSDGTNGGGETGAGSFGGFLPDSAPSVPPGGRPTQKRAGPRQRKTRFTGEETLTPAERRRARGEGIRLSKALAQLGVASRRKAEDIIFAGRVQGREGTGGNHITRISSDRSRARDGRRKRARRASTHSRRRTADA